MTRAARWLAPLVLLGCSGVAGANPPVSNVPVIGCPSDGQLGPRPAPSPGRTTSAVHNTAYRLAYYSAGEGGVLAPRGWHCVELSGSNGTTLIVMPDLPDIERLIRRGAMFDGPGVVLSERYGGTSGRRAVAAMIARYFPDHRFFLRRMEEAGFQLGEMPTGPFPDDLIHSRTATVVDFTTPAGRRGLGTEHILTPGGDAIRGLVALLPQEDVTLIEVAVRLPEEAAELAAAIIDRVRWDRLAPR